MYIISRGKLILITSRTKVYPKIPAILMTKRQEMGTTKRKKKAKKIKIKRRIEVLQRMKQTAKTISMESRILWSLLTSLAYLMPVVEFAGEKKEKILKQTFGKV